MSDLQGFRVYSASIFSGYASSTEPGRSSGSFVQNAQRLPADVSYGASGSLGWTKTEDETHYSVLYSASYFGRVRYSDLKSANQLLSFQASRKLGMRWHGGIAGNVTLSNFDDYLFMPTVLSQVAGAPGSFDDLASAVLDGRFANNQIASLLTGAPVLESPARTLLLGNRVLATSLQANAAYSFSPRLTLAFSLGAGRSQFFSDGSSSNTTSASQANYSGPIGHATSGTASATVSYSLDPRTRVGGSFSVNRSFSGFQDAYASSSQVFVSRTLSRRLIANGHVGIGKLIPVRQTIVLNTRPQLITGAGLSFKASAQTLLVSMDRTVIDTLASGSSNSLSATGAWVWSRPSWRWAFQSNVGWYQMNSANFGGVTGWRASAGAGRLLTHGCYLGLQYGYLSSAGKYSGALYEFTQSGVRASITYSPGSQSTY